MILHRTTYTAAATFGVLIHRGTPFALTLENPWRQNERNVSCIPAGEYQCRRTQSPRFGETFTVLEVPGRSHILFHKGNVAEDTEGCILVGEQFGVLNGEPAVLASGAGYDEFMAKLAGVDRFWLTVV